MRFHFIARIVFVVMLCSCWSTIFSQDIDSVCKMQLNILQIDEQTDVTTIEELSEAIAELSRHPIDINNATHSDIEKLAVLSDFQIMSLWNYLEKHRPMLSVYELRTVLGFDSKDVDAVKSFIVCKPIEYKRYFVNTRVQFVEQFGETMLDDSLLSNPKYAGKMTKTFVRVQTDIGKHLHVSTTAEKDAGEHFNSQGFDFYSCNIFIEKKRLLKKLILGDFSMHFGQGLVAWNGYSFRNVTDIRKRGEGLIPYKSVDENMFYRGLGFTLGSRHLETSFFASKHRIDATIDTVDNCITTIQKTGYHRTNSELFNKHSVCLQSVGANVHYKFTKGNIGFTHVTHCFEKELILLEKAYNYYSFSGNRMSMSGIDFFLNFKRADVFGEAAINEKNCTTMLVGGEFQLNGMFQFSALFRKYEPGYYSFMNSGFSASSACSNETGFYMALRTKIDTVSSLSSSIDFYKHPWLKYGLYDATFGSVTTVTYERNFSNTGKCLFQFKHLSKAMNDTTVNLQIKGVQQIQDNRLKLAIYSQLNENWRFITQAICAFANANSSPSVFLSQDIDYTFSKSLKVSMRYAVFDASYESRISVYESDVRVGSNASFFGEGDKFYIKAQYAIGKQIMISAKYAYLNKLSNKQNTRRYEFSFLLKYEF